MPMVSLKLMAGAARSMVVASARTTGAAEIAARSGDWGFFRYKKREFSIQDIMIYMMIYDDITPKSDFELHALHPT
jgi:hypothetical protein